MNQSKKMKTIHTTDYRKDRSLVEQTQKDLLTYIANQKSNDNSHMPKENEMAEILGVSRVVVREALSRLRAIGVLETKRKKGTVLVCPRIFGSLKPIIESGLLERDSLRDLYELRLMLEIGMADFIFRQKTEKDIEALQEIIEKEETAKTTEESIALDIQFHSYLYSMTKNASLSDFHFLLEKLFAMYAPRTKDYKVKQVISHAGLVEVLRFGSPDSFRIAMRLHLNTQFENMEKILDRTDTNGKAKANT